MGRRIYIVIATLLLAGCGESNWEKGVKLINEECGPKYDGRLTMAVESGTWSQNVRLTCELPAGSKLDD